MLHPYFFFSPILFKFDSFTFGRMTVEQPFEGAEPNLRKLLERNLKLFHKFDSSSKGGSSGESSGTQLALLEPALETERCVVYQLQLVNCLLFEEGNSGDKLASVREKKKT